MIRINSTDCRQSPKTNKTLLIICRQFDAMVYVHNGDTKMIMLYIPKDIYFHTCI